MEEISGDSASSVEEARGERHRSHWTMRCDGKPARRLKTQAVVHRALDLDDDDMGDLPPYPICVVLSYFVVTSSAAVTPFYVFTKECGMATSDAPKADDLYGPVSVQEGDAALLTNNASEESIQSPHSVISMAVPAHNGPSPTKEDRARQGKIKEEIKNDMESRKQNLTVTQIKEIVSSAVTKLKNLEEYHHGDGLRYQKSISDIYWENCNHRSVIGDFLADIGYAELTVKMLKQMNGLGVFKSDDIWFPTYYTYKTCWNYSDASEKLATCLAASGIVKLLTLNLGHTPYLDNIHSKNVYYVLKASLSTLHNIARCAGVLHHFKEMKTAEVILPLRNSSDDFLKSMAMLTLVYLVEEKDNAKLVGETNIIKKIINLLQKALEDKQKGKFHGLSPIELIQGLARLAVYDLNKAKIIEDGALDAFVLMLQGLDPREQALCAECIWLLSFDKRVRQIVTDFPEFLNALENLKDCENQVLRRNIRGALWLIKGEGETCASGIRLQNISKSKNQVFISFSLSERGLVKQLSSSLTTEGYNLWVDWDQTGGSTLQTVAEAVASSALVLICMSERYTQSPACRLEAECVFHQRKDYILLLMQKHYLPDGWLHVLAETKPYIDFSGKYPYEKSVQGLLKEMRGCGISSQTAVVNQTKSVDDTGASRIANLVTYPATRSTSSTTSSSSLPLSNNGNAALTSMSNEHVENWLASKGLHRLTSAFSQIDGQLIWQLKRLRETTPEYFYSILERQFGMTLIDILRFNAALDTLQ